MDKGGIIVTYAFNEVFRKMIDIFNIEISAISFEVDRHESRVRHWKKDSLPAKSLMVELLPFLCKRFEEASINNQTTFKQFMFDRGYSGTVRFTSKQLLATLESLIKDRKPFSQGKVVSYQEVLQQTRSYEQKEDFDGLLIFCENLIHHSFYELNDEALAHLNLCITKHISKQLLVNFDVKEFEKAITLLDYSLALVSNDDLRFNITQQKAELLLNEAILTSTLENAYQAIELFRTLTNRQNPLQNFKVNDTLAKALNYIGERAGKYKYFEEVLSLRSKLELDYFENRHEPTFERMYLLNLYGKVNVIAHLVSIADSKKYYALAAKTYEVMLQSHFSPELELYFQATLLTLSTLNIEFYRLTANDKYLLTASALLDQIKNSKEQFAQINFIFYVYTFSLLSNQINVSNYKEVVMDVKAILDSEDFKQVDHQAAQKIYLVYISKLYLSASIYECNKAESMRYMELYNKYRNDYDADSLAPQWSVQTFLTDLIFSAYNKVKDNHFDCCDEIIALEEFEEESGDRKTPIAFAFFQVEKGLFYELMNHHLDDEIYKVKMELAFNMAKHSVTELEFSSIINCFRELEYLIDKTRVDEVQSYLFDVPNRVVTE